MTSELLLQQEPAASGDDMRQFLYEIRQYPLLTPEQERELAKGCAEGDAEAIRQMVNSNLRLVVSVAREYAGRGVPLLDLIQEGSIGLLVAAKKFDYTLDFRFSTYATKWIRQGVTRCLVNHGGIIRVPVHTQERIRKVQFAQQRLRQLTGEEPSLEEIAAECGLPEEKVRKLMQLTPEICSLDAPAGAEDDGSLALLLEDMHTPQPYEELVREELNRTMERMLSNLTERQQQVMRLRFGMHDGVCYSLEQVGNLIGVTKERARQIEHQAMAKLQKIGRTLELEDFLE